ncbi:complement factor H-related protein 4-like [Scleropages formosus]|uniref:complement factor H-related protein 4-like n=1 Tax=Scleropages formosus TaxID=113540 RepID=UPI0008789B5D|nr:complement factor H-related protein 4-like [Scleropages formosus]
MNMKGIKIFFIFSLWMPFTVVSAENNCSSHGIPLQGNFELASDIKNSFSPGESVIFSCQIKFTCDDGFWKRSASRCQLVKCEPIQPTKGLVMKGNFASPQYNDVIEFECQSDDNQLNGPGQIQCTEKGEWSGPIPECEEIRCQYPLIQHGNPRISDTIYKKNYILRFSCEQNYIPVGSGTVRCTKTGWSQQPRCEEQTCSVLYRSDVDEKSFTRSSYKTGEQVYFTCKGGYRKKENTDYITCTEGVWEPRDMCEVMTCSVTDQDPFVVGRSRHYDGLYRVEQYQYGYTCKERYEKPDRNAYAQCTINGWKPDPLCQSKTKRLSCKELPEVENGDRISEKQEGDLFKEVTFQCRRSYTLEGKETVRCRNGNWEELPKCLKPCAIENIPEKHHLEKLPSTVYVEEGKTYRFTCKSRYYKDTWYWSTNVEGICKNGHMEFPTCVRG